MAEQKTLPEALGLSQEWYDETAKKIEKNFGVSTDTISELMAEEATAVRDDEFGDVNVKLSAYEKKLVLVGYLIGLRKAGGGNPLDEFLRHLFESRGQQGGE